MQFLSFIIANIYPTAGKVSSNESVHKYYPNNASRIDATGYIQLNESLSLLDKS